MSMESALIHDSEFLSAVFCALPDRYQLKWLDTKESSDRWSDMMIFLDDAYEKAMKELTLRSVIGQEPKQPLKKDVKSFGVNASGVDEDEEETRVKNNRQRAKDSCGKCPICDQYHTWKKWDGTFWPSDRFISCRKFSDMNTQQRASAVEKAKGCPKCTGWGHQKQDCRMKPRVCGVDMGSSKCSGDHSKMLHGSGNIYCAAVGAGSAVLRKSAQRSVSESDLFACVNEHEDTLYYLQDIPIKKSKTNARLLWDRGSNRVLIRDDFAKELKLISKEVIYNMVTVGDKLYHSFIYLLDLVDMFHNVHTVWDYGVPKIMFS